MRLWFVIWIYVNFQFQITYKFEKNHRYDSIKLMDELLSKKCLDINFGTDRVIPDQEKGKVMEEILI